MGQSERCEPGLCYLANDLAGVDGHRRDFGYPSGLAPSLHCSCEWRSDSDPHFNHRCGEVLPSARASGSGLVGAGTHSVAAALGPIGEVVLRNNGMINPIFMLAMDSSPYIAASAADDLARLAARVASSVAPAYPS